MLAGKLLLRRQKKRLREAKEVVIQESKSVTVTLDEMTRAVAAIQASGFVVVRREGLNKAAINHPAGLLDDVCCPTDSVLVGVMGEEE